MGKNRIGEKTEQFKSGSYSNNDNFPSVAIAINFTVRLNWSNIGEYYRDCIACQN